MTHWDGHLNCVPSDLRQHPVKIVSLFPGLREGFANMLLVRVVRDSDGKGNSITLMIGCDPDGDLTEPSVAGGWPVAVQEFFKDFGITKPEELLVNGPVPAIGIYAMIGQNELGLLAIQKIEEGAKAEPVAEPVTEPVAEAAQAH